MNGFPFEPVFAALLAVSGIAGLVLAARRTTSDRDSPRSHRDRIAIGAFLAAWTAGVLFMTLRPGRGAGQLLNLAPLSFASPAAVIDAVLNVGVFMPLGILLAAAAVRLPFALLAGLLLSVGIETGQYFAQLGRTADVNDVFTNTTGTLLGWAVAAAIVQINRRRLGEP